ncbi:low-complexity protein [Thiohalocapsa marina]|uniref:Low-complexity protein n=1 Tax=Thiohalocapsa marina TaxID=424902 RepID=A0A5M8FH32_9GAMM|nr:low-complexity protein [Thiohalocapsa marina]KAA6184188.1 low-complexity protein [Thiohalocapsa marina]
MTKKPITPVATLVGATLAGSLSAALAAERSTDLFQPEASQAALSGTELVRDDLFEATPLASGYMLLATGDTEGKCGGGQGDDGKDGEGKCGEGKCGEGTCGSSS